ncbi:MAG: hypothetical protein HY332_10170 [Chloroflexi bacterium]|nr:hypothetical protein [Chloroflexota bacterium]
MELGGDDDVLLLLDGVVAEVDDHAQREGVDELARGMQRIFDEFMRR